jgi:DNA-directed RNA polymerase subunit RPC12/RpoP
MARAAGTHTYDIYLAYHGCPECGKIVESRAPYEYRMGVREKELQCPRCSHEWTERCKKKVSLGPLLRPEELK